MFYLWDPLDCKNIPAARDEYRDYVSRVFKLLISDANEQEIAEYLTKIEIGTMGRNLDSDNLIEIARTLHEAKAWYCG
ncbi:hypothetical protein [Pseudoalteromonas luteoviolacea]|uniref:hypothetical protein n=1 Tax=Pseudoalteromonas luteoviolacea TaxID=43657 RepID=UPI000B2731D3|nr:hypothetical protein [Pseudoalteromonas luteoviolacea]